MSTAGGEAGSGQALLSTAAATFGALQGVTEAVKASAEFRGVLEACCEAAGVTQRLELLARPDRVEGLLELDGHAHVTEARWTRGAVAADVLYAFRERLQQRDGPAWGLFVSGGKFTPGALSSLVQGAAPNFVMLDRDHLIAVLQQRVDFGDLLRLAGLWLHDRNQAYVPVERLLRIHR